MLCLPCFSKLLIRFFHRLIKDTMMSAFLEKGLKEEDIFPNLFLIVNNFRSLLLLPIFYHYHLPPEILISILQSTLP